MDKPTISLPKKLIISADDYGMSKVYNDVIEQLIHEKSISSVSVMVRREEGKSRNGYHKLAQITQQRSITVGLHFEVYKGENYFKELKKQIDEFERYIGRSPDSLDIHAPHKLENDFDIVTKILSDRSLPIRNMGQKVRSEATTDSPALIAHRLTETAILSWLSEIGPGIHEIVFHPGKYDPACKSTLNEDRSSEADMARRVRALIDKDSNLELCNYHALKN